MESSEESELDPEEGTSRDTSFTETLMSITRERSTQANLKPKSKSTKTQTFFHSKVQLVDKATNTTDLNTTETDTALEENIPTDTATEVDVQSVHSGVSEESSGPSIEPSSSDESDENPDEIDCNLVERTILI